MTRTRALGRAGAASIVAALALAPAARAEPVGGRRAVAFPESTADGVAAVVDGDPILVSEVVARAWLELEQVRLNQPDAQRRDAARRVILRRAAVDLVEERLVLHVAAAQHIEPSPAELDARERDIADYNHLTVATLEAEVARAGMDRAAYRRSIAAQLAERTLLSARFARAHDNKVDDAAHVAVVRAAWIAELRRAATIETRLRP